MLSYMQKRLSERSGFSLVEIMVVILIVGVLAAIAIPVWAGQQKTQADDRTKLDSTAAANALKELVIQYPTAPALGYRTDASNPKIAHVWVDINGNNSIDANEPSRQVNRDPATNIAVRTTAPGKFQVYGWNPNGRHYISSSSSLLWDSQEGGLVEGVASTSLAPM